VFGLIVAKKPSRGKGMGKGVLTGSIGKGNLSITPVVGSGVKIVDFADAFKSCGNIESDANKQEDSSHSEIEPNEIVVEAINVETEDDGSVQGHHEVDFECLSMGSDEDDVPPIVSGEAPKVFPCTKGSDWRGLFHLDRPLGNL
jgi:hypothetical protein